MNFLSKVLFTSLNIFTIELPKQENFKISLIINILAQILLVLFVFYFLYRITWEPFIEYINNRKNKSIEEYEKSKKEIDKYKKLQKELKHEINKLNKEKKFILNKAEEKAKDIIHNRKLQADELYRKRLKENEIYLKKQRDEYERAKYKDASKIAATLVEKLLKDKINCNQSQVQEFINRVEDDDGNK